MVNDIQNMVIAYTRSWKEGKFPTNGSKFKKSATWLAAQYNPLSENSIHLPPKKYQMMSHYGETRFRSIKIVRDTGNNRAFQIYHDLARMRAPISSPPLTPIF